MAHEMSDEDVRRTIRLAYGPEPEDGLLLTGRQIQMFARATIEHILKPLEVLKWDATR